MKFFLRPKKIIICFSGTARVTFNSPAPKIFIAFPVFILKKGLYVVNCQFRSAVICRHFVCWLAGAHDTKSRKKIFPEITRIHRFIAFHSIK